MRIVFVIVVITLGVATGQQGPVRPDLQQVLSRHVSQYTIKATNLLEAAAQISSDFDVPMGVEWQGDPDAKQEISDGWHDATVGQIIHDVTAFDIRYQVETSNNVVHLHKPEVFADTRNPLNFKVPSYSVTDDYTRRASSRLGDQLIQELRPHDSKPPSACAGSYGAGADETRVTLSMTDATVRDILDALLTSSRSAMWVAIFPDQQPKTGFLKTNSLWRNGSESEGPQWNFVAPYSDPATGRYRGDWQGRRKEGESNR